MPTALNLFCVKCLKQTPHMPGGSPLKMYCYCTQEYVDQLGEKDIHRRLQDVVLTAKHYAKEYNCNYNIILKNPVDGELGDGSTYEYVTDSYFEKERPNVLLLTTTMRLGVLPFDIWLPYTEYEKQECDIKLKDGTIVKHCYPNAGEFSPMCADSIQSVPEEQVAEIMYRQYYVKALCTGDCNETGEVKATGSPDAILENEFLDFKHHGMEELMYGRRMNTVPVRTEPKIHRNEPCPCGSGKKYKKCCIKKP